LPESSETSIELITDELKSAALGAVYKTVASVVVKSTLAFVIPKTYCGIVVTNIISYHLP
tara:strand:- start:22 stop:201 length:180 start_codon:yes stop_codon:yes gene_type:complete